MGIGQEDAEILADAAVGDIDGRSTEDTDVLELPPKVRRQTARLVYDHRRTQGRPVLTDAEETRLDTGADDG